MKVKILFSGIVLLLSVATGFTQNNSGRTNQVTWSFDKSSGTFTLSGNGEMENFIVSNVKWKDIRSDIRKIIINEGVKSIGNYSFQQCVRLDSIVIPEGVERIGERAFMECKELRWIVIPKSVNTIGESAFMGCCNLVSITNHNPNPVYLHTTTFDAKCLENCILWIPDHSVSAYQKASRWNLFQIRRLSSKPTGSEEGGSLGKGRYLVIVGGKSDKKSAEDFGQQKVYTPYECNYEIIKGYDKNGNVVYRVSVGNYDIKTQAMQEREIWIKRAGFEATWIRDRKEDERYMLYQ